MRYYLDTNILAYLIEDRGGEIASDTKVIFEDYANSIMTSTVCAKELVHLFQIGKLGNSKKGKLKINASSVLPVLKEMGIQIIPVTENHLKTLASLPVMPGHTDPDDRLIISQAISDHIPLISSDRKFALYRKEGLDFRFNER